MQVSAFQQLPEEVLDLALHPVVGLVLQVGDVEKFPQALGFQSPDTNSKKIHLFVHAVV